MMKFRVSTDPSANFMCFASVTHSIAGWAAIIGGLGHFTYTSLSKLILIVFESEMNENF